MLKIKTINLEMLKDVNDHIFADYGQLNRITSGTLVEREDRSIAAHIVISDECNVYKSLDMLKGIGKFVKEFWGVSEVYYFGTQIA